MLSLPIKSLVILIFVLFMKKLSIDLICVSPIPSRSTKFFSIFFLIFRSNNFANSWIEEKKPAKIFAFS